MTRPSDPRRPWPAPFGRARGAALLIALLAVALAAVLASELIERGRLDLARSDAIVNGERAWQYAAGIDALARDWIGRRRAEPGLDLPDGQWSAPFTVPGGVVRGRIIDLGGRFNLNRLASPDPERRAAARAALVRLLAALELSPDLASAIAGLYAPSADGRIARLIELSELNAVAGFGATARQRLLPRLVLLPDPEARLNVNQADPVVLAALLDGLDVAAARALLARGPFESIDQVLAAPEMAQLDRARAGALIDVSSDWFDLHAQVTLGGETRDYFKRIVASAQRYDGRLVRIGLPGAYRALNHDAPN